MKVVILTTMRANNNVTLLPLKILDSISLPYASDPRKNTLDPSLVVNKCRSKFKPRNLYSHPLVKK